MVLTSDYTSSNVWVHQWF